MTRIHFFNPETEIVLALDKDTYTPNPRIARFRRRLALLPALYGNSGDMILSEGIQPEQLSSLPFYDIAMAKGMKIISLDPSATDGIPQSGEFSPWGWNREVVKKMASRLPELHLPSQEELGNIRRLANRALTADFFRFCTNELQDETQFGSFNERMKSLVQPVVIDSSDSLDDFLARYPQFCLKAPWSSSGRGVIFSTEVSVKKATEWAMACIRKQGAVMGEPLYQVRHNLASEWMVEEDDVRFLGFSFFKTSEAGKYLGNMLIPQQEIVRIIEEFSEIPVEELKAVQKEFIRRRIARHYSGPLGFDMLITPDGILNPCVEINLRRTMGHLAIEIERQLTDSPLSPLFAKTFPDRIFSAIDFV